MNAIVPDTLQGAVIVSVIDFFLSFLIISGIGVVLSFFPWLNRLAKLFESPHSTTPAHGHKAVPDHPKAPAIKQDDVAAIAAALAVVLGPHRILHISESKHSWSQQGRDAQHSHQPRHK